MLKLSDQDRQRIEKALDAAEAKTTGEIFCVHARSAGRYREIPLGWAAGVALILPIALVPFGFTPDQLPFLGSGWRIGQTSAVDTAVIGALAAYAVLQAALFAVALVVFSIPPIKRALTPRTLKRERVRKTALEQFMATAVHLSPGRTGVLIFAAEAERMVEIVAEQDIHEKAGEEHWEGAVDILTKRIREGRPADGFVEAIERCGHVLAEHFPSSGPNPNEIPNRIVEL
jgi:putative membrane protein